MSSEIQTPEATLTQEQKLQVMALREEGMSREEAIAEATGQAYTPTVEVIDARPHKEPEMTEEQRQTFIDHGLLADDGAEEEVVEVEIVEETTQAVVAQSAPMKRAVVSARMDFSPEDIQTIKNTVAKGATDGELGMFLHICQTYGLDPFLKEIYYSPEMKTIMSSRDGYMKVAQRDANFVGMKSAVVCENDDFVMDAVNGTVEHKFKATDRGSIMGAWAMVTHKMRDPVLQFVPFSEYNKGRSTWKSYPSAMILKCAESIALKRQFGITGLVTTEEMGAEL